jgi:hypothetical protein
MKTISRGADTRVCRVELGEGHVAAIWTLLAPRPPEKGTSIGSGLR